MKYRPLLLMSVAFGLIGPSITGFNPPAFAADIENVRFKADVNKTEIILDLNDAVSDLNVNQDDPQEVTVQFSGRMLSELNAKSFAGRNNLKSMYVESQNGKVQVFFKRQAASDVNVYTLENPHRLIIRIDEAYHYSASETVAPGVIHRRIVTHSAKGPLNVNVLEIDSQNPDLIVEPVLARDLVHGKAKVHQMVRENRALAGINAAFFKPDSGTNLGTTILNNELISGPIYNRVSLGITTDKQFKMSRISLKGTLTTENGQSIAIHNVNQPRLSKEQYIVYTPRWGNQAPSTPPDGIQIQVQDNQVINVSSDPQYIPRNGFVLVGPAFSPAIQSLKADSRISLEVQTVPDWSDVAHAISGGPYLVKNGQVYVDLKAQSFRTGSFTKPAPRTAIGITEDNRLLMVTVDGRQDSISTGVTLSEMAQLMKDLGAVEAMNLDGGSSTQMVIKNQVVNVPTVSGGVNVSSALIVRHAPIPDEQEVIGVSADESSRTSFSTKIP